MSRFDLFFILIDDPSDEDLDAAVTKHIVQNHVDAFSTAEERLAKEMETKSDITKVSQEELKQYQLCS